MLLMIWIILISLIITALASRFFYIRGYNAGYTEGQAKEQTYWDKLRQTPIAGQVVEVPSLGTVIILGRGDINGVPHIDYIPQSILHGRNIPDIHVDELNRNTISCPLDEFIAQCEVTLKLL